MNYRKFFLCEDRINLDIPEKKNGKNKRETRDVACEKLHRHEYVLQYLGW